MTAAIRAKFDKLSAMVLSSAQAQALAEFTLSIKDQIDCRCLPSMLTCDMPEPSLFG